MEMRSRSKDALALLGFIGIYFAAIYLTSCLGLEPKPGALVIQGGNSNAAASASCPGFSTFSASADPILQSSCLTCHGTGGPGNSFFSLSSDTASNYAAALTKILSNDGGDFTANPIVAMPMGSGGHTVLITGPDSAVYVGLTTWISAERASPCTSN